MEVLSFRLDMEGSAKVVGGGTVRVRVLLRWVPGIGVLEKEEGLE